MFAKFKYERIPLSSIRLDERNPRIVTQEQLSTPEDILKYFFEYEGLADFLKKIALEGRNQGAERPYVVKDGNGFVVVEGNTRIACYKLLTGQLTAPAQFSASVPLVGKAVKAELENVDCSIAPTRDALLPIMASSHFGLGDKSKWGYLGSRKAVYDEWQGGKAIPQLASVFARKQPLIRDLIVEYKLYLAALKLPWTDAEKAALLDPAVEFNPPVRFLQSSGHKSAVGITLDRVNLEVVFENDEAVKKFRHLVKKLVVSNEPGMGATATYADVFADYVSQKDLETEPPPSGSSGTGQQSGSSAAEGSGVTSQPEPSTSQPSDDSSQEKSGGSKLKPGALFNYALSSNSLVLVQLMKEAQNLNTTKFPAAGTALLRAIVESILKHIIHDQSANPDNKLLSLELALDISLGNGVKLNADDKKILKEFKKSHLDYVNLGAHATSVPNHLRLISARDCVDQFIKRNI
jgi:hypothetical protein